MNQEEKPKKAVRQKNSTKYTNPSTKSLVAAVRQSNQITEEQLQELAERAAYFAKRLDDYIERLTKNGTCKPLIESLDFKTVLATITLPSTAALVCNDLSKMAERLQQMPQRALRLMMSPEEEKEVRMKLKFAQTIEQCFRKHFERIKNQDFFQIAHPESSYTIVKPEDIKKYQPGEVELCMAKCVQCGSIAKKTGACRICSGYKFEFTPYHPKKQDKKCPYVAIPKETYQNLEIRVNTLEQQFGLFLSPPKNSTQKKALDPKHVYYGLVFHHNNVVSYNQEVIPLPNQQKVILELLLQKHDAPLREKLTMDEIREALYPPNQWHESLQSRVRSYVSSLHRTLKRYFLQNVIEASTGDGWSLKDLKSNI